MKNFWRAASLLLMSASFACAQSAFDGNWKMNTDKSKLTGDSITFADAGGGSMKYSDSSESYTFKLDGSESTTPFGSTVTWKQTDPNTYEHTSARNGQPTGQSTWKISPDGKSLDIDAHGKRPNGEDWHETSTYTRVSGSKGLAGTWRSTKVNADPATMSMKVEGDMLHWDIPQEKAKWDGKLDGKDVAPTGPQVPADLTLAVNKGGANSLKMVEKLKGKPIYIGTYTVSADGKTMTVHGTNGQGKEPVTEVWEKQ